MVDMSKVKDIKVVYYVDTDDDVKGTLCAVPSDKDMRSKEVIEFICKEIYGALYHEIADAFEYEFGIEEIPLLEC